MLTLMFLACIQPESGRYDVTLETTASDCPEGEAPAASPRWSHLLLFDVEHSEVVAFQGQAGTCPFDDDGLSFRCELAWLDTTADYASGGLDAVVTVDVDLTAEWIADRELLGSTSQTITCEGADCAATKTVSPPACTTTWAWTGRMP